MAKKKAAKKKSANRLIAKASKRPQKKGSAKKSPKRSVAKVSPDKGKSVESYVAKLDDWQAEVVAELHKLILSAAPKCTAGIKWGQPVYERNGPFAHIKAFAKHVNFGFWRGVELPDPKGLLTGTGDKMRHVKISSRADVNKAAFKALIKAAVKINEKKGDPTKG